MDRLRSQPGAELLSIALNVTRRSILNSSGLKPFKRINILYEDTHVISVYKPPGLLIQGDVTGDPDLLSLTRLIHTEPLPFLGLVHRLDRPASGVVVFGKSRESTDFLNQQFRQQTVEKIYLAVVHGITPESGEMEDRLLKDPESRITAVVAEDEPDGQFARLTYQTIESRGNRSLVRIRLITGRSHQVRIQFSSRGFPIVGDRKYGSREVLRNPGLIALCAFSLTFSSPHSPKKITVMSPRPEHWPWYDPALFKQAKPNSVSDRQRTVSNRPQSNRDRQRTVSDRPQSTHDHQRTASDKPHANRDHQRTVSNRPQSSRDRQRAASDRPHSDSDHQRTVSDKPHANRDRQQTISNRPQSNRDHQRAASDKPHASRDRQRTVSDRPQSSRDHQRTASDKPHASRDHQRAASDKPHTSRDRQRTVSDRPQSNRDHQRAVSNRPHANRDRQRTASDKPHANRDHQRAASDKPHSSRDRQRRDSTKHTR